MNQASRTKPTVRHEFYPHSNQIYDKKTKMKGLQEIVTQAARKQSKKTTFNYNQCRCYLNRKNQSEGMTRKVQMVLLRLQRDANGQWWWWLSRPLAASKQVFPSFTVSTLLPNQPPVSLSDFSACFPPLSFACFWFLLVPLSLFSVFFLAFLFLLFFRHPPLQSPSVIFPSKLFFFFFCGCLFS